MFQARTGTPISNGSVSLQDIGSAIMTASGVSPTVGVMLPSQSTGSVATAHRKRSSFFVDKLSCLKKYEPVNCLTRLIAKHNYTTNPGTNEIPMRVETIQTVPTHKKTQRLKILTKSNTITNNNNNNNNSTIDITNGQAPRIHTPSQHQEDLNTANIKVSSCSTSSSLSPTVSMDSLASNQSSVLTNYANNSASSTHSITTATNYYLPPFKFKIKLNHRNPNQIDCNSNAERKHSAANPATLSINSNNATCGLNHSSSANDIERISSPPLATRKDRISDESCSTSNRESDCSSEGVASSIKQSTGSLSKASDISKQSSTKSSIKSNSSKSGKKSKRQDQMNLLVEYLHRDIQPKLLSLEADELELAQSYKKNSTKLCDHCLEHANLDDLLNNQPGFRSASSNSSSRLNVRSERTPSGEQQQQQQQQQQTSRAESPSSNRIDHFAPAIKCYNCSNPISVDAVQDRTLRSARVEARTSLSPGEPLNRPSSKSPHNIASWIDSEITSLIQEFEAKKRSKS